MKKSLSIIALLLSINCCGQINYGIHLGYSRAGGYDKYKYKDSGIAGLFIRYTKNNFFLSGEINYIARGGSRNFEYTDANNNSIGNGKQIINTSYLQIPILIGGIIRTQNCNFFIHAGPYSSFLLNSKYTLIPPSGASAKRSTINGYGFSSTDFGLMAGIGIELKTLLFFETRIEHGLSGVNNYLYGRNTAISLMMGLKFGKSNN